MNMSCVRLTPSKLQQVGLVIVENFGEKLFCSILPILLSACFSSNKFPIKWLHLLVLEIFLDFRWTCRRKIYFILAQVSSGIKVAITFSLSLMLSYYQVHSSSIQSPSKSGRIAHIREELKICRIWHEILAQMGSWVDWYGFWFPDPLVLLST